MRYLRLSKLEHIMDLFVIEEKERKHLIKRMKEEDRKLTRELYPVCEEKLLQMKTYLLDRGKKVTWHSPDRRSDRFPKATGAHIGDALFAELQKKVYLDQIDVVDVRYQLERIASNSILKDHRLNREGKGVQVTLNFNQHST